MKFTRISLENFQGIRNLTMDFPGGCSASIYGDNATGKTTVFNAYTWLLFDKASTGAKGFSPKTRDEQGEVHHLSHGVTGTFETDGGQKVVLRKVYHEIYKKKRGSAHEEFDGNTIDYFVNGVPAREKEYSAAVSQLCDGDIEKLKILSMPDYFAETMPWDTRRKILLDVCGDITDEDVVHSRPELAQIHDFLDGHSIDEYKKIAAAQRRSINEELKAIPQRVDEAQKAMPLDSNAEGAEKRIAKLTAEIDRLKSEKAALSNADTPDLQRKLADVETEISDRRARYMERQALVKVDLQRAVTNRDTIVRNRGKLLSEYAEVQEMKWDKSQETCPTCGQKFPDDEIDQMMIRFLENRKARLKEINERGKSEASKEMLEEAGKLVARLEADSAEVSIPYESTEEYKNLIQKARCIEAQISGNGSQEELAKLDKEITINNQMIQLEQERLGRARLAEQQKARIAELEDQEKNLSAEYDRVEQGLYLCDLFTRTKVGMLDDHINGKFQNVRFQLFTDQINGGVKEGCDILVPTAEGNLVPFAYANNAARINAGLEIISTLAAHWQIEMPVFIDNAESVTRLQDTNLQTIRLVVSESDKALRLECK